jgi:hypothetical protein
MVLIAYTDNNPDTILDIPPIWNSTPAPVFLRGRVQNYNLRQHITDDGKSAITYNVNGTLPNGITIDSINGIIEYDGTGSIDTTTGNTAEAIDEAGTSTSSTFSITIVDLIILPIPNLTIIQNEWVDMSQYIDDPFNRRTATDVTGLTTLAIYDSITERLTGVNAGNETGLVLEVDGPSPTVTHTSNTFTTTIGSVGVSDTPDYVDPVAGIILQGGRTIVNVSTDSALTTALNNAEAGDTIRLATGTYTTDRTLNQSFPMDNPLIIESAVNFGAVITGRWNNRGAYNILNGLLFSGTSALLAMQGINCKALACGFTGTRSKAIQLSVEGLTGRESEIAYCEFWELNEDNNGDLFRQAIKMSTGGDGLPESAQDDVWIHHNWFHDIQTKFSTWEYGQGDLIEWGESGQYNWALSRRIGLYFEDNLIERFERGSNVTMDMKIGGYVVRRNTQRGGGASTFTTRFGGNGILESNYMNPGGIKCFGRDNIIVGNDVDYIYPQAGEIAIDTFTNLHHPAYDNLITGNIGTVNVGRQPNANYNVAADGNTIEDHTGNVLFSLETNTTDDRNELSSRNFEPVVELQVSDVGPNALANAPTAYRAARIP